MAGNIRLTPTPSKYIINEQYAGKDKYWANNTSYDDLLFARGQHVKDYADLSYIAKGLAYSKFATTLSQLQTPLLDYASSSGTETITKNFVRWRIYGEPERRAMSFGNPNSQDYIGTGGLPFLFRADVPWFKTGDLLSPVANKRVQIAVVSDEPTPVDGAYEYETILWDEDDTAFIPEYYFEQGAYWIKMGSVTSWEKAGSFGSIQFGDGFAYVEWEIPLTTMGWTFEVEGEAHRQWGNLEISRCDDQGNPLPMGGKITNYLEAKARAQVDYETELFLTYGTQAKIFLDKNSGKAITTGPGVQAFLEEGNVIPFSVKVNGIDSIAERLEALWFDRVPFSQREVILYTGQAGMKLFSEWVNEKFGNTASSFSYDFYLKSRTPYDARGGRDGYAFAAPQFVEYVLPTYGVIKIAHWPLLDNTRINGVLYPGTFYPVSSYEFFAFNIGFGESNVKFVMRDDNKIDTIMAGLWSPFGATGIDNPVFKNPAYQEESYRWLHRKSFGVVMMDPSLSAWFKPNIVY